jgi:NADPH:quinone reductase-like Zn-dependent oxidoreductase
MVRSNFLVIEGTAHGDLLLVTGGTGAVGQIVVQHL